MRTQAEVDEFARLRKRRLAIGKRLREARKAKCLTQVELSKLLNVSPSTVCQVEQGKVKIPYVLDAHVVLFCDALKIETTVITNRLP